MKRNNTQNISILSICILILIILFSISELLIHQNKVPVIFFSAVFIITYITNSYKNKKRKKINEF